MIKARLERDYSKHHPEPANEQPSSTSSSGYESFLKDRHHGDTSHAVAGGGFVQESAAGGFLPEDDE